MSSKELARRSGLLTILSGALFIFVAIFDLFAINFNDLGDAATTPEFVLYQMLSLLAAVLLLVGLVGLYARQLEEAPTGQLGTLGLVGFLVAFVGTALVVGVFWAQTFGSPVVAEAASDVLQNPPPPWLMYGYALSIVSFAVGWILFGWATYRARIFPRASAVLLIIGAALSLTPVPFTEPVFAVAIIWMGYDCFSSRKP